MCKKHKYNNPTRYEKTKYYCFILIILHGGVTFFFNSADEFMFSSADVPKSLMNIILFELLCLRYVFYVMSFACIIGLFA